MTRSRSPIRVPPDHGSGWQIRHPSFFIFLCVLISIGMISRFAPLCDQGGRLLRQFPSEDGYLMLQIAKNMAQDRGMSVSEGTIATNGTQPFCTFVWSICFRMVDCDKRSAVFLVLLWQSFIAMLSGMMLFLISRLILGQRKNADAISGLAAAGWFSSTVSVPHTMNCLETGTYVFSVLIAIV